MIIFLAAVLDVPQHLYESAELDGAGAAAAHALRDAADGQPGDPVRRRPRRDPGPAVLHAGLRRGEHRSRAGVAGGRHVSVGLGYPNDSTLFYPVLLYQHGFNDFQMGYASAMAMLLLIVSFAVTLVIVLNSRRWVHQAVRAMTATGIDPVPSTRSSCGAGRRRRVRRRGCLISRREPQPADRRRDRLPRTVRLHRAHVADDDRAGALVRPLAATPSGAATSSTSSRPAPLCAGR